MPRHGAERLVVLGFLGEVLQRLPLGGVGTKVTRVIEEKLGHACLSGCGWPTRARAPVGKLKSVGGGRKAEVVLANVDGDVYALEDRCSHQAYPLSDGELEGERRGVHLPWRALRRLHGAHKGLPAVRPVKSYPVQSRDDGIYVEI